MVTLTTVQSSHTYGVLDPKVAERRDTKFVGGSLSDGNDIIILPQGGYTRRGGSDDFGRLRRALEAETVTEGMLTLPNGGTAADLLDADTAITTSAATGSRFVLFEIDFGASTTLHFIDLAGVSIATTAADGALIAEWHDGAGWQPFGAALKIDKKEHTRRFASGAPGHAGHAASRFRVAVDATTAAGAVTFSAVACRRETATLADAIVRCFRPEGTVAHQVVYSEGNADIFVDGVWQASADWPVTAAMLRQVKLEPKYDTVLGFHVDLQPHRLFRLGASSEWSSEPVDFENVPLVDYGGDYTNGVTAVQQIGLYSVTGSEQFELTLEGETTTSITVDGTPAVTAADIKAALEALTNVDAGLTVASVGGSPYVFDVTFTGGDNAERPWLTMVGTALDYDGYVRVRTTTKGKSPGEAMISAARGWPAVGRYAKQRLIMAGMKSRPKDMLASVQGDAFDLNTAVDVATAAFSYEIDGKENTEIRDIVAAQTLLFVGDKEIAFLKNRALSATELPEFGVSDSPGIKPGLRAATSDNAVFYGQDPGDEEGDALRLVNYTAIEESFVSDNASILSAHLIDDPVDLVRRRATRAINADLLVEVNEPGTITVLTMMRTQEVSGYAPWTTDGAWLSADVDADNALWFTARREIDGTDEVRLERYTDAHWLDGAVTQTVSPASATVTGLAAFNGRAIWIIANDQVFGPVTPSGGSVTLDGTVSGSVIAGSWARMTATDPDVSLSEETRRREARLKRVCRAVASVHETTSLAMRANDGETFEVPLRSNAETIADTGPLAMPVTGKCEAEGMHGFTAHGRLTVTQLWPGALTIRSIAKDIAA